MVDLYVPAAIHWQVLDLPSLRDCDPCCPGVWVVAARTAPRERWRGAEVFVSRDDSVYESFGSVLRESTVGFTSTVLGDVQSCYQGYVDRANSVDVDIFGGKNLFTVTEDDFLDGANLALIGGEIVRFQDVEQIDEASFRLTTLLRGRSDTLFYSGDHVAGEQFALLDPSTMLYVPLNLSDVGAERYFKVVSPAGSVPDAESRTFIPFGSSLRPFSPCHVTGSRNVADDLLIRWTPRTRARARLLSPARARSCCCEEECYVVEVMSGSTVLRTLEVEGAREATYTASQQTSDGLTPGDPVTIRVFGFSKIIGRSFAKEATV